MADWGYNLTYRSYNSISAPENVLAPLEKGKILLESHQFKGSVLVFRGVYGFKPHENDLFVVVGKEVVKLVLCPQEMQKD